MQSQKLISNWLIFTAFMVFAMAVIGAITRLTESGLSMVEWRPLMGAIPPLSDEQWHRVFSLYQETPEYIKKNAGMELAEFKNIFFWEWFHRLWGRLIGLVYALPLLYFWLSKKIPDGYKGKLLLGLVLGGLQGLMGWYMVKSGLVDRPSVSHFRLAAHLSLAFLIYAYLLWLAFDLRGHKADTTSFCLKRHGWITMITVAITVIWGAFVAGLDAGLVYNSWPLMGGHLIPYELTAFGNIIHEPVSVQFTHRWIAILAGLVVLSFAYRMKSFPLAGMVLLQIGLGISTLLSQVMIPLAALHQAGAFILVGLMVYNLQGLHKK
ncbi:MAG TPA: COX15/CtaA family protein [Alphaproteobacteria bacterium]|nr:COX15/CtaA family protein [Alphaproteobacteria bacterium]